MKSQLLRLMMMAGVFGLFAYSWAASHQPKQKVHTEAALRPGLQQATFAAGCFWSMQAIFQQIRGVVGVTPGYAGGSLPNPSYEQVEAGTTGYAESINLVFDPKIVTYRQLLQVLLIARNPTTINQQGPDTGTQYRSVIFYRSAAQKSDALKTIHQINASHHWPNPIVTKVQPFTTFSPAEAYHFDYYNRHTEQPYCALVIKPEIDAFRKEFRDLLRP